MIISIIDCSSFRSNICEFIIHPVVERSLIDAAIAAGSELSRLGDLPSGMLQYAIIPPFIVFIKYLGSIGAVVVIGLLASLIAALAFLIAVLAVFRALVSSGVLLCGIVYSFCFSVDIVLTVIVVLLDNISICVFSLGRTCLKRSWMYSATCCEFCVIIV